MSVKAGSGNDGIPENWDELLDPPSGHEPSASTAPEENVTIQPRDDRPSRGALALASWAELAVLVAPCAAALAGVRLAGYAIGFSAVPWAGVLAFAWWLLATAALLLVRRTTAGMLSADLQFSQPLLPRRVFLTVFAILVTTLLAGFPALVGVRFWLPSLAAGSPAQRIRSSAA